MRGAEAVDRAHDLAGTRIEHLDDNLAAADLELTPGDLQLLIDNAFAAIDIQRRASF